MTKPDSGAPDPSANQDDAVWLDLVARLEGSSSAQDEALRPGGADTPKPAGAPGSPESPAAGTAAGRTTGTGASFRDFDPLGLAPSAPTEPSAAERLAAAATPGTPGSTDDPAQGPRDYGVDDDDTFVPEEPPSLAGTDPLTMLAWLGAVGGPLALLLSVMFWRSAPLLAILGMVAVFILSVVYLIMKLPQEKDENDDGARV
ncbi:hypothetical protein [Arthrobacter sp. S39]|uniref:hypothetical protein n=1 Tax=Arthrobacter sp. S39 TaxID=2509720 RepID=UPI001037CDBA|nr:hypothetical protein [Arthrobacter sp. S39]TAP40567.1 hypothetical protein EYS21_20015 [Arthrobacter sp. S39]